MPVNTSNHVMVRDSQALLCPVASLGLCPKTLGLNATRIVPLAIEKYLRYAGYLPSLRIRTSRTGLCLRAILGLVVG
eukprot:5782870-Pleurochrysis_carterae.AAC.1